MTTALSVLSHEARADEVSPFAPQVSVTEKEAKDADASQSKIRVDEKKPGYMQLFATTFVGDGLRFNNPYRLATPLGSTAESISRTAPFVDVGLGATFGGAGGFSHGMAFRTSFATSGVSQAVLVPSYLIVRRFTRLAAYARVGPAIVVTPTATWGGEASVGGILYIRGGIGVAAEVVGDVFYGAGTYDVSIATYPVLSAELGLVVSYEVLAVKPSRANLILLSGVAVLFLMAPTVGDVGGCGTTAEPLSEAAFAEARKQTDCKKCTKCDITTERCAEACDGGVPPDVAFPATCKPLYQDGLVCIHALTAASCSDYARYMSDTSPEVPSECQFCLVVPQPVTTVFLESGAPSDSDLDGGTE